MKIQFSIISEDKRHRDIADMYHAVMNGANFYSILFIIPLSEYSYTFCKLSVSILNTILKIFKSASSLR